MSGSEGEVAEALGQHLGGTVSELRRLSGGASRVTSRFDLFPEDGGAVRPLILQQDRGSGVAPTGGVHTEAALLRAARDAGVPVPEVVALEELALEELALEELALEELALEEGAEAHTFSGDTHYSGEGRKNILGAGWLVVERIEGETIPRKLLRDDEWAGARDALTGQCGRALAAIHSIDPGGIPGLAHGDPLRDPLPILDLLHEVRPALELGVRWLEINRPEGDRRRVTVHGDFRIGNLLVGPDGLRAVLDWELAHGGDPAEDIGWLCAPAWRFGGPRIVGGFGEIDDLLAAYMAAGGEAIDAAQVKWWQVYATVKWATICVMQASAHLSGATRSVELAAIGRRVCESEWDLFVLLGATPTEAPATEPDQVGRPGLVAPFGRPTLGEMVEAVREYIERNVMERSEGGARFEARIARNVLQTVERQIELGPAIAAAHSARLAGLGFDNDAALAHAIRSAAFDADWHDVAIALAGSARDQLLVANPSYLPAANV